MTLYQQCKHGHKGIKKRSRPGSSKPVNVRDARSAAESISSYLSALPTIQVHPELDGRTLDIVHCFYNIAGHFSWWKVAFSALIKLQFLHVHAHVLFSLAALFATRARARARVVFTGSTFALFDVSDVSATNSDTFSKSSKSPRNPNSNVG